MGLWEWPREARLAFVACGLLLLFLAVWFALQIVEEANKPLQPGDDMFFLNWRNTPRPPIIYQDANGDELDAIAGCNDAPQPSLDLNFDSFFPVKTEL